MASNAPREMTGAELKSMLKSSINLKSLGGVKCEELNLAPEDLQWWRDAKVGMFVHWGLYSILGRGEWVRHNEQIPWDEYKALADEFAPENFEMSELTGLAKDFGAKYMVLVAKHHDGFSLWNSKGAHEGFTSNQTSSKRDFVKEYVEACHADGLRVGLYYSPMDGRFPGYFDPAGLKENAELMKKQCYDQVRELTHEYGTIDILWYDGGWLAHKGSDTSSAWFWEPVKLNKIAREPNPKMLINPRSGWEGDFYCDEGSHPITGGILPVPWEKNMCVCSGSSWGWMPNDPVSEFDDLIVMLANVICRDGNWLLNVGPDKNGKLAPEIVSRMKELGAWLKENGESVYSTRGGPCEPVDGVFGTTYRDNNVYIHILDRGAFRGIALKNADIQSCKLLDGTDVTYSQSGDEINIQLPQGLLNAPDTIVKLTLAHKLVAAQQDRIYFTGKE